MLDYKLFVQNITMLAEVYERDISKAVINTYYEVIKTLSDDDFKFSVRRILSERTYATFPKPAEFISMADVKIELHSPNEKQDGALEQKAKELIDLVRGMNDKIFQDHIRTGISFDTLLSQVSFPNVDKDTISILNNIKPYYDYKQLVANINHYQTTKEALNAFKTAILKDDDFVAIENARVKEMLSHKK